VGGGCVSSAVQATQEPTKGSAATTSEVIAFPSLAWFEKLADLMNANRARQEKLGYVDCVVQFTVLDGGVGGTPWGCQVTFEEFEAVDVREASAEDAERADFALEATLATWRGMIESVAAGGGRPDLQHTLNYLSHPGTPIYLRSDDPLRRDMYFRFNQSLQEFVNASGSFRTTFGANAGA
jgi:hypothetical protein